jgi:hypothetical protein
MVGFDIKKIVGASIMRRRQLFFSMNGVRFVKNTVRIGQKSRFPIFGMPKRRHILRGPKILKFFNHRFFARPLTAKCLCKIGEYPK